MYVCIYLRVLNSFRYGSACKFCRQGSQRDDAAGRQRSQQIWDLNGAENAGRNAGQIDQ